MYRHFFVLLAIANSFFAVAQVKPETQNVILITLDGFRWQEVFQGADPILQNDRRFVKDRNSISIFEGESAESRRSRLLPFFWSTIATSGQLYGNRNKGNQVDCSNPYWFSYPGYSEMLVGAVDKAVCSNLKVRNPNSTVLGFIARQPDFHSSVAAFSTWDVFPYILGNGEVDMPKPETDLIRLADDSATFHDAVSYLQKHRPRVLYIALDETDHSAHADRYDNYLMAAHRADRWIGELWRWVQSDSEYSGKTTLLITTDHGRGQNSKKTWRHHGRFTRGSGQIWIAALGPDTPSNGEITSPGQLYQKQVAKSMAALLGLNYENKFEVGPAIPTLMRPVIMVAGK